MTVSSTIGAAWVEIHPELGKLFQETSEGVSKAVDEAAKKQQSSFDKISKVGQAAFVGLTSAAVGFGAAAVKEALEGEKAHALLEAAVHGAGSSMEGLEPKIEALSAKFAKLGFVNDEVEAGLTRLTQITQSPTRALELMGVTADLARARHIGLEQAATLVGRAAEGNVTALKRMGIEIQTTGDKAKDGQAAITELQKRFGGAAQAEAGTYAGKLAAFRAEVSNLEERIGGALLPVLAKAAGGLADMVGFFEHNRSAAVALGAIVGGPLAAAMAVYAANQAKALALKLASGFTTAASAAVGLAQSVGSVIVGTSNMAFAAVAGGVAIAGLAAGFTFLISEMHASQAAAEGWAHNFAVAAGTPQQQIVAIRAKMHDLQDELNSEGFVAHVPFVRMAVGAQTTENKIHALRGQLNGLLAEQAGHKAAADGTATAFDGLGDSADAAGDSADATSKAVDALASHLGISSDQVDKLAKKLGIDLSKGGSDAADKIQALNDRLKVSSPATLKLDDALAKLRDTTVDATEKASAFDTALELLVGGNVDSQKAVVNFENAIDGLGAKLKANAASFDVHTKAGRDDITMVEDAVTGIRSHIEAMQAQGFTADQIKQAFAGDTEELRKQLEQTGLTKAQVDKLLASYGLVPGSINTIVTAETTEAQKAWNDLMASAQPYLDALAKLPKAEIKGAASTVTVPHFASGGFVPGPAGQAIPAVVHAGEFVLSRDMLRSLTKPAQAGPAPIPAAGGPAVHIENLTVQGATTAGAFATARELVRAQIAEVYRRTGVS